MEPSDLIHVSSEPPIAVVTIDHPPANALNTAVLLGLEDALTALEKEHSVRAVVLTGAGRMFVAGADIAALQGTGGLEAEELARQGNDLFNWIERSDMVFVAAVNGACLGGGNELALVCDLRIAAESARFGMPEVNLGLIPGWGGIQRLPHFIGKGRALELLLSGALVSAGDALAMGWVNQVVPDAELLPRAREVALRLAGQAPLAVAQIKSRLVAGQNEHLTQAILADARSFAGLFDTADAKEGIAAFLTKRKPVWRGR